MVGKTDFVARKTKKLESFRHAKKLSKNHQKSMRPEVQLTLPQTPKKNYKKNCMYGIDSGPSSAFFLVAPVSERKFEFWFNTGTIASLAGEARSKSRFEPEESAARKRRRAGSVTGDL